MRGSELIDQSNSRSVRKNHPDNLLGSALLRVDVHRGNEIGEEDCTDVLSEIDYAGACRLVDERPRVAFFDGEGNVLDIRDYTNTDTETVNFNLHSATDDRVTILACEDGLVGMIVYYDAMGDGQIAVDFNGTGPFG